MFTPVKIYNGTFDQDQFDKLMLATADQDGLMSKEDKVKLDSLADASQEETVLTAADVGLENVTNDAQVKRTEMGVAGGVATLDEAGLVPASQLPAYVDDVEEAGSVDEFPAEGEGGKIYVDTTANKAYRWSGSQYVVIPEGIALGETASTAYPGDKGKAVTDVVNSIVDGTTSVPKAVDAETVAGFTVAANVPEDAVFTDTDTTYEIATSEVDGLMSADDKAKLDEMYIIPNTPYYDEESRYVYACGTPIIVEAAEEAGKLRIVYTDGIKDQELIVPENCGIIGGGDGRDKPVNYVSTCITVNSGKIWSIAGGNRCGNVGNATIVINGGTFSDSITAGGFGEGKYANTVGHAEVIINKTDDKKFQYFGGGQGLSVMGSCKTTINGGTFSWVTTAGVNGHTANAELVVNGGDINVLQGCNRGTVGNIKTIINAGTIKKVFAGGETGDASVTATYGRAEVIVNGGTIESITAGTDGGVESEEKVIITK